MTNIDRYEQVMVLYTYVCKDNSYKKMVSNMDKEQVVELMTETIINLNIGLAKQKEMPQDEIDQMAEISRPQFRVVNGILYDVLKENGAIA
jgi:hypothetical protein